ncbi:MAG: hypothetical protein JWP01_1736 [Myxococcales bacterium]|nr:hypothetical protein [Myxococcales bacterium]
MNLEQKLSVANEQLRNGDLQRAMGSLADLFGEVIDEPRSRMRLLEWVVERVAHPDPEFGAHIAVVGGALVEHGASANYLGRALMEPVLQSLVNAKRLLDRAATLPDEPGEDTLEVGDRHLSRATVEAFAAEDVDALNAWLSLSTWYRPAVAAWARQPSLLRELQATAAFRAALAAIGSATETSHWLSLLIETVFDARFVVLIPELREVWSVDAHGVVDMGQLTVLLSEALAEPLARLGASEVASPAVLDVMRGIGPQEGEGSYPSTFAFYQAASIDPASGLPQDGKHTYVAPGGTGDHSLPADFLPGTIAQHDGARLLVMVGPNGPGLRFVRVIPAVRTFDPLRAHVDRIRKIDEPDAAAWIARAHAIAT